MSVAIITTWPQLLAMEHSWNELSEGMPLRSWDWLGTWWRHYGRASDGQDHANETVGIRQLRVVAVYDDSAAAGGRKLIGIAPWFMESTAMKGNVLRWMGSGEVCTDHLSLVCGTADLAKVAEEVAHALTTTLDDWDRLELGAVDAGDFVIEQLLAALEERECLVSRQEADSCWVLELPASWDGYLASISKSHRKQLRQLERRVLQSDRVAWHRVTTAAELEEAWPILVDLHQRRRRRLGEPGCFASPAFHHFHREISERLLAKGQLRLSWLSLDDTPVAAEYHVAGGATVYAYQGGVDPDRLDEEPGRLSTILCLQQAIREGHRQMDFMRGDEPYKAHWRAAPRETFDCRVVPNRRLARLRGRVLNLADTVTDWMRQAATPIAQ